MALADELKRARAEIIRGLVQIAGAEPVRVGAMPGQAPGPTAHERLRRLVLAFPSLIESLDNVHGLLGQLPPGPVSGLPSGKVFDRDDMIRTVDEARTLIDNLLKLLATGTVGEARLASIPEEARRPLSWIINEWCPIPKIFVAVHGIGDQFQNETVQTVAFRICDYVGQPQAIPLGRFRAPGARVGAFLPEPTRDPVLNVGFAEIYWADVPRVPSADKHILEEPRKWARTLVERLRLKSRSPGSLREQRVNDERVQELLEEIIQGVTVADRIASLAAKAGLFKFDLKGLLNDFLNDVQVVTEFEDYREQLLAIFGDVMTKIHEYFYASEIYVISHSEGTVVSFMGLLKGLYEQAPWASMVHGYMTIGSPLNKHVFFWPELFDQFAAGRAGKPVRQIPWKNYYDFGDPIAYNLAPTREWLKYRAWAGFFAFTDADDIGFTRYYFPGEAHNEYWQDPDVFGHFIQTVVDPGQAVLEPDPKVTYKTPTTRPLAFVTSYILPYVLASGLLFLACYLLYKAVHWSLDPIGFRFESPRETLLNVAALWGLVGGMSLLARIPRLGAHASWWVVAVFLGVGFSLAYFGFSEPNRHSIQRFLGRDGDQGTVDEVFLYNTGLLAAAAGMCVLAWGVKPFRAVACTLVPVILWILGLRIAFWLSTGANILDDLPLRWLAAGSFVLAIALRALVWLLGRFVPLKAVAWTLAGLSFWFAVPLAVPAAGTLPLSAIATLSVAWVLGLGAWAASWYYPRSGTRPLVHTGGLIIFLIVVTQLYYHPSPVQGPDRVTLARAADRFAGVVVQRRTEDLKNFDDRAGRIAIKDPIPLVNEDYPVPREEWPLINDAAGLGVVVNQTLERGPIWPIFLAAPAFLYIWWLAIVTFDLSFVWHLYIRYAGAQKLIIERLSQSQSLPSQHGAVVPPRPIVPAATDGDVVAPVGDGDAR